MSEPEKFATSSQSVATAGMIPCPSLYKILLRRHAEIVWKQIPVYHTVNEGSRYEPKFRCTVMVNGVSYTSPNTFQKRKTAEMDASRIAYFEIFQELKNEALSLVREDKFLYKIILAEFAAKMHMQKPAYQTAHMSTLPVFSSSLVFGDVSCTGDICRTKKEAEQSVARAVILKYIDSESGIKLSEIIKSKYKQYTKEMGSQSVYSNADAAVQHGTLNGHSNSLRTGRTHEVSTLALTSATPVRAVLAPSPLARTLNGTNEVVQTGTVNGHINCLETVRTHGASTRTLTLEAQALLARILNDSNKVVQTGTAIRAPPILTQTPFAGTHGIPTSSIISASSLGQVAIVPASHTSNLENLDTSPVIVKPFSMSSPAVAQTHSVGSASGKKPNCKTNVPTYTVIPAPSLGQVAIPVTNSSNVVQLENSEASLMTIYPRPSSSPAVAQMNAVGTTSSKKRSCKSKRNARKKTRADIESPIAAITLNQIPPFYAQ